MPVSDRDKIILLEDPAGRLGELWRSQGDEFLAEQAAELAADLERLRAVYAKGVQGAPARPPRAPKPSHAPAAASIDLRDEDVSGMVCSRHGTNAAAGRCRRCREPFCSACIVRPEATGGEPLCTGCALVLGGVHRRRPRPLVAPRRERS